MNNKLDFLWSVKIRPVAKLIFKIVFQQVFELSSSSHRFTPWGGCWLLAASLFHYHLNLSWSLNKASSGETGGSWSARLRRVNLPGWYHLWDRRAWGFEEIQEQCKAGDVMRAEKQKNLYILYCWEDTALRCFYLKMKKCSSLGIFVWTVSKYPP